MVSFTYEYVTSGDRLPSIATEVHGATHIAIDTETTGLDPRLSEIRLLSINTGKNIYVIDAFKTGPLDVVLDALVSTKGVLILQNGKFDQKMLMHHNKAELNKIFDTYRASSLIYNGKKVGNDLWSLYSRELGIAPETQDLGASDWSGPLTQEQLDYAAEDVWHLPNLRKVLIEKLKRDGLMDIAKLEFDAILPESAMELKGFHFDKVRWLELAVENNRMSLILERELKNELPHPKNQLALPGFDPDFNLQSPQQLLTSLRMIGLKIENTAEITLAMHTGKFPVVDKLLDYRGYAQAVKTFGADYLSNLHPVTGRIHTSFFPYTGAGRYSSSKVNLQQLPAPKSPKRKPWEFRDAFRAPPGKKLLIYDYSQVELRIAAEIAQDETLMGVYIRGEDAHKQTASLVSNIPIDQVTKLQRQMAKAVNFGLVYGMTAPKLVLYAKSNYGVDMSLIEAEKFRERYFDGYSGIRRWHREIFSDQNKRKGMARTPLGRLRYLDLDAHNEHSNTPVQGAGADGLKIALRVVYDRLKKYNGRADMVTMVHDEIVTEVDDDKDLIAAAGEDIKQGMVEGMQRILRRVPVVVEGGAAETWADK